MASTESIRTITGIIGNVISCILFLSPAPTFLKIMKMKSVEDFKPDPYVATILNCLLWCFYGMPFVKHDDILVLSINAVGLAIEIVYVLIFLIYSPMNKKKKILLALVIEVVFLAAVVLIAMLCFKTDGKRATFVGILCIIFNIIMYASPLTVMRMVIRTKSVKYMPFYLSLANFCNGAIWTAYAALKFDINVFLPNCLGTISGLVQLALFAIFYRRTKWDDASDDDRNKSEVQLSSNV